MSRFWQFAQLSDAYKNHNPMDRVMSSADSMLFIGGLKILESADILKQHGITHVLSVLEYDHCNYKEYSRFQRLWISAKDHPSENLLRRFDKTNAFIEEAFAAEGRVLVHCAMGVSRSATIVCAYMMYRNGGTFLEALRDLQQARPLCAPNVGFVEQLEVYERMRNASSDEQRNRIYTEWLTRNAGDSKL